MATYAIVKADGREYKVQKGQLLDLDLRKSAREGDEIILDQVLLISDGGKITLGTPTVKDAAVSLQVVQPLKKGPKVRGMRRSLHATKRRRYGHRQQYTTVRVLDITGASIKRSAEKKDAAEKAPAKEAAAEKAPAKKAPAKKSTRKKAAAKKTKKAPAKKKKAE